MFSRLYENYFIKINKKLSKKLLIYTLLLPKFKGLNTFSRMLENKEKKAGCTVHYVNEKLDSGCTIVQKNLLLMKKIM